MDLRVTLIQPQITLDKNKSESENSQYNYDHALELLNKVQPNSSDLIVFPEHYPGLYGNEVSKKEDFAQAAKSLNSWIIAGEIHAEDNKKYNSAVVFSRSGKLHARYNKNRLWLGETEEGRWSGAEPEPIEIEGYKIGILICSDFYNYELPELLARKGIDLLVVPSLSVPAFLNLWRLELLYTTEIFKLPIIYVNAAIYQKPNSTVYGGGKSKVLVPFSGLLTKEQIRTSRDPLVDPNDLIVLKAGQGEEIINYTFKSFEKFQEFRQSPPSVTIRR